MKTKKPKKVWAVIKKEIDWGGCYYEGDTPDGVDFEMKLFAKQSDAEFFKKMQNPSWPWNIEEREIE